MAQITSRLLAISMERIRTLGLGLVEPAALLALVRWVNLWWALVLAAALWWYHARAEDRLTRGLFAIALISLTLLFALNTSLVGQILLAASYGAWFLGRKHYAKTANFQVWQAGWLEFIALSAAFSAEAIWHWSVVIVLAAVYAASLGIAHAFFAGGERAVGALATAWGLIVVEASLLFSIWLVQYVLPKDILLVPQPAVVITVLGYCFGSIYVAHSGSRLSRARLAEYAIIGLCLVMIVIAGTHWSGAI